MRLVIIGSGNVAHVLATKFLQSGHEILQVVGRNKRSVGELAEAVHATAVVDFNEIVREADVYLIAVSDDAVRTLEGLLPKLKGVVAHTAGAVRKDLLGKISNDSGIFYPLQSLKIGLDNQAIVPIMVDGNNQKTIEVLTILAGSISNMVQLATDEDRARLHLAATVVNNFSNHLYALAYDYCRKENLAFDLLIPLIRNTVEKLGESDPSLLQTGPAKRKDDGTIEKHLFMLQHYPELKTIYETFSASIMRRVG